MIPNYILLVSGVQVHINELIVPSRMVYGLGFRDYLEVQGTYNLLSNCSYNPIISRVTVVMGLVFGL